VVARPPTVPSAVTDHFSYGSEHSLDLLVTEFLIGLS
jgi:hypothetical protein